MKPNRTLRYHPDRVPLLGATDLLCAIGWDKAMKARATRRSFLKRASLVSTALALGARRIPAGTAPSVSLPYTARQITDRLGIS
ncbi:MAG: twin-arginine translocation signal domain-containing protein, partial [Phycisphaerales bacterium]